MIQITELRTGNWVKTKLGKPFQLKSGADIDKAGDYDPIRIDKQVLLQCGFRFDTYFQLWQKKEKNEIEMEMDSNFHVKDFGHRYLGVEALSLHQVQNLFFALKQRELNVANLLDSPASL